jgi:hypothetical protein
MPREVEIIRTAGDTARLSAVATVQGRLASVSGETLLIGIDRALDGRGRAIDIGEGTQRLEGWGVRRTVGPVGTARILADKATVVSVAHVSTARVLGDAALVLFGLAAAAAIFVAIAIASNGGIGND